MKSYNEKRRRSLLCCPFGKHIRSLLLFSSPKGATFYLTNEEIATIPNTYPLLRVLNIEFSINLKLQLNGLSKLHLLKYLAIKGNLDSLPKSFRSLRGLETLVIETTARKLDIDEAIWKMKKLRHVHTNISVELPLPPKIISRGKDIRTLSTISPKSCTEEILQSIPNLQKLGVCGDLSEFLKEKLGVCGDLSEFLKEMRKTSFKFQEHGNDEDLPVSILKAPRLKKLSISATLYDWRSIFVLGSLHELEVLKLDDYAFKGENWDLRCNDIVFKQLQYLHIGRTNLVTWRATHKNFPVLRSLILRKCSSLKKIPQAFANVHTLEVMELFHMSESAVQSAEEIQKNLKNCGFQLQLHITNKMGNGARPAGRDTMIDQAVSNLVEYVEWSSKWSSGGPAGLYSELKEITLDIETFNARLQEAYKNPCASVDVLMVKTFRNIVNEAQDGTCKYLSLNMDKTLIKCWVPRYTTKVESCESIIKSVRSNVDKILKVL
nr:putative late blight resistance protein homolog R1B-8 [Ipomoea batatas]